LQSFDGLVDNVLPIDIAFIESLPPSQPPHARSESHNAAYIIPTSGTTGQPKLTVLEHGNFCTSAKAHFPGVGMDVAKPLRSLQFAAHSFDASIIEILTPLMYGGTVCIPDEHTRYFSLCET
jgi:non-ribosomal peptide synthetase component F